MPSSAGGGHAGLAGTAAVLVVGAAVRIAGSVHKVAEAMVPEVITRVRVGGCEACEEQKEKGRGRCGVRPHYDEPRNAPVSK